MSRSKYGLFDCVRCMRERAGYSFSVTLSTASNASQHRGGLPDLRPPTQRFVLPILSAFDVVRRPSSLSSPSSSSASPPGVPNGWPCRCRAPSATTISIAASVPSSVLDGSAGRPDSTRAIPASGSGTTLRHRPPPPGRPPAVRAPSRPRWNHVD